MLSAVARSVRNFGRNAGAVLGQDTAPAPVRRPTHPRLNRQGEVQPLKFEVSRTERGGNRATRRAKASNRFRENGGVIYDRSGVRDGRHYHATKGERGGC